ncbi:MAG: ribonuclease P protein component [bacterium]|nr:ribonuclease P protein component [bacterium]
MPDQFIFPRHERLTRKADYLDVYQCGSKRVGRQFVCYTVRRQGQGRKIGFAVSRRVGNAVVRNRVKRYIREFYRTHRGQLADDVYMVLVARQGAATLDFRQCSEAIRQLLESGKVLSG